MEGSGSTSIKRFTKFLASHFQVDEQRKKPICLLRFS